MSRPDEREADQDARLHRLFADAVELPRGDRQAWLDRLTGLDARARHELTSLLAAYDASEGWLEGLADDVVEPLLQAMSATPLLPDLPVGDGMRVGRYELLDYVGRGGMGVVYRARDVTLDRLVALKFLVPGEDGETRGRARLLDEARAASALDHPNIAVIHEIGALPSGRPYLAMAWCDGETLAARLQRGPLSVREAVRIAVRLADALAAAHAAGIVHRDVKPANVMIGRTGEPRLLDFGISTRSGDPGSQDGSTAGASGTPRTPGTLAYMSPEQADGGPVDARTDIWSLGVVLFEMLTGERPCTGDATAVHSARHTGSPPSVRARRADVPRVLDAIVARCLERVRDARWPSSASLRDALAAVETIDAEHARTATARPSRRAVLAAGLALVGIVLVAVLRAGRGGDALPRNGAGVVHPLLVAAASELDGTPAPRSAEAALLEGAAREAVTGAAGATLVPDSVVRAVLVRMRRVSETPLAPGIGREVAEREGVTGVVEPTVVRIGARRILSLRLVTPDGSVLASIGEEVSDGRSALAVGARLTTRMRDTIAVLVGNMSRRAPLPRVTTTSLEALRLHARALGAWSVEGDQSRRWGCCSTRWRWIPRSWMRGGASRSRMRRAAVRWR